MVKLNIIPLWVIAFIVIQCIIVVPYMPTDIAMIFIAFTVFGLAGMLYFILKRVVRATINQIGKDTYQVVKALTDVITELTKKLHDKKKSESDS